MGRRTRWWHSGFGISEQFFKAGAGLNKPFFGMAWQALDVLFNFQGLPSMADPLLENQRQWAPPPKILGAPVILMLGKSSLNIGGDAGVQAPVPASDHVDIPVRHCRASSLSSLFTRQGLVGQWRAKDNKEDRLQPGIKDRASVTVRRTVTIAAAAGRLLGRRTADAHDLNVKSQRFAGQGVVEVHHHFLIIRFNNLSGNLLSFG